MQMRSTSRVGAACAVLGVGLLFAGTFLHPMDADPNVPAAAFAEYAADTGWITSHLMQLAGVASMVVTLLLFADELESKSGAKAARIAAAGAIISLALAAALQAVDGIALKAMADAWVAAPAPQRDGIFQVAFAVRQIEIGLASMFSLSMGVTAIIFGLVLIRSSAYPKWFACLAIVGGLLTAAGGLAIAYTGFSGLSMAINMPANVLLLLWMLVLAVFMWRRASVADGSPEAPLKP